MKNDHVLLILEGTYPWHRGGVSEWVHQYLQHTSIRLFNILQIADGIHKQMPLAEALYTVPGHVQHFERISPPKLNGRWKENSYRWWRSLLNRVGPLAEQSRFIHIVNTGFAGWLGKELAACYDKKLILTEHALYWKEIMMGAAALECGYKVPEKKAEKEKFADLFQAIAAEIYRASDIVISVSKHNIPAQQKQGARDVRYIPNGVPAAWLEEPASVKSPALTIGWIGRCAEMKNPLKFFDVIDAFNRYGRTNARFLMVICESGEPGLEQKVRVESRKYAQLEVVWNRSAKAYIDQMDALCITSHNESQPLVLLEALSKKVLPAGWRTGDVTREFGLILDPGATADKLVADIMELWREPVKWERVVNRRFVKIKKHHTWEKIFARYDTLFSSLTETDII